MDGIDEQLMNNHNLSHLVKSMLLLLFPNDKMLVSLNAAVGTVCEEWGKINSCFDAYRCPIDIKGKPSTKKQQVITCVRYPSTCPLS